MTLSIDIRRSEASPWTVRVVLAGSLDGTTAPRLEEALAPLLETVPHLVFDLSALRFISSAGIRVLLAGRKQLKALDGSFALVGLQAQIARVFEIVGPLPGFSIFGSEEELAVHLAATATRATSSDGA